MGTELNEAILVGAGEIGPAAFVSTLCICIVFVPMFFLSGVARFLFVPLAEAVVFAMLASYILSRTLVPTLVMLLMGGGARPARRGHAAEPAAAPVPQLRPPLRARAARLHAGAVGAAVAARRLHRRVPRLLPAVVPVVPVLGRDFFPGVDAGQIRLHMRTPTGTRIEETARTADEVEAAIRELIPKDQLETILDNLGVPTAASTSRTAMPAPSARSTARSCSRCTKDTGRPRSSSRCCARSCQSVSPASSSSSSRPTSSRRS